MYPYLINFGIVRISSFTVFAVLAVFIGVFLIWKQAKERLYSEDVLFDTIFLSIAGGFMFARIGYIAAHLDLFGTSLLKWLAFWVFPGFYLHTGIIGALFIIWYQSRQVRELDFWRLLDFFGFAFWIIIIIGSIGVFLGGLEEGIISSVNGISHPVTLYKLIAFMVVVIPYLVFRYEREKEDWIHKTPGTIGLLILVLYSFIILVFDVFKMRTVYGGLSIDQWISLLVFIGASGTLYVRLKRNPRRDVQTIKRFIAAVRMSMHSDKRSRRHTRRKR